MINMFYKNYSNNSTTSSPIVDIILPITRLIVNSIKLAQLKQKGGHLVKNRVSK